MPKALVSDSVFLTGTTATDNAGPESIRMDYFPGECFQLEPIPVASFPTDATAVSLVTAMAVTRTVSVVASNMEVNISIQFVKSSIQIY